MTPTINSYPVFQANQVLTAGQLNNLFGYLDEQNRITRVKLIGMGIVCGLELSNPVNNQVVVSRGVGLTSAGYLILLEESTLTHYRSYTPPSPPLYEPFLQDNNPEAFYPLWEMLPSSEAAISSVSALNANFLDDKAVLLYLENPLIDLKDCIVDNCKEKGQEVRLKVVKLLIRKTDLIKIIQKLEGLQGTFTETDLENQFRTGFNLPTLFGQRFDVINTQPKSAGDVFHAFARLIDETAVNDLVKAIDFLYHAFAPFLSEGDIDFTPLKDSMQAARQNPDLAIQYYYDWLLDLIEAYHELRDKALELLSECSPDMGRFPMHLMLGEALSDDRSLPTPFRHYFIYSPLFDRGADRFREIRLLYARLGRLIKYFDRSLVTLSNSDKDIERIRITPSRYGADPLSEKAIPFHYVNNEQIPLFRFWSYFKTKRGRSRQNLSYHADQYADLIAIKQPLRFNLEPCNFFRIAGHIGLPYNWAVKQINDQISYYRLPFKVVALATGNEEFSPLHNFLQEHPGVDHRGGVLRGGTFLLIYQGEEGTSQQEEEPEEEPIDVPEGNKGRVQFFNNFLNMKKWETPITIYLGNEPVIRRELVYQSATPFIELPVGSNKIGIEAIASDGKTFKYEKDFEIEEGRNYIAVISGLVRADNVDISDKEIEISVIDAQLKSQKRNAIDLKFFNGVMDIQGILIKERLNGTVINLDYTKSSKYLSLTPVNLQFTVYESDSNNTVRKFAVDFTNAAGSAALILLSDFWAPSHYGIDGFALKLLVVLPDGKVLSLEDTGSADVENITEISGIGRDEKELPGRFQPLLSKMEASMDEIGLSAGEKNELRKTFLSFVTSAATRTRVRPEYPQNTVIADLFLPYLCCGETEGGCNLPCDGAVISAYYKWDMSNGGFMQDRGYQIKVFHYEVDGNTFVSHEDDPIFETIMLNNSSALLEPFTSWLNKKFPRGLIFEAEEGAKSVIIIHRFACQVFQLEIGFDREADKIRLVINEEGSTLYTGGESGVMVSSGPRGEPTNYCKEEVVLNEGQSPYEWLRKKLGL